MTGEISTGSAGQIVVPELAEIRAKMQSEDEAYAVMSESLNNKIETTKNVLTALNNELGSLDSGHRALTMSYRKEKNSEAARLLHAMGEIDDRHTDECYKIFAYWFGGNEESMISTYMTLARSRQQAQEADEETLIAVLDEKDPDNVISRLWRPSVPLIGVNGLTADIGVGIRNGVVAYIPTHESKSRVIELEDDNIVTIPINSFEQAVPVQKDDPRVEQLVGLGVIDHIIKYSHFDSAVYSVMRVIKARDILGLVTPKEEILQKVHEVFREKNEIGRVIAEFEVSIVPAIEN